VAFAKVSNFFWLSQTKLARLQQRREFVIIYICKPIVGKKYPSIKQSSQTVNILGFEDQFLVQLLNYALMV